MSVSEPLDPAFAQPPPARSPRRSDRPRASPRSQRPEPVHATDLVGPGVRANELAREVMRRIREQPMQSIAAAVGIGFVVGGALSFRAGRLILSTAARQVARQILKQLL